MEKTFFIVEDHSLMRHGITSWITENSDWKCAGMAQNKEEAIKKITKLPLVQKKNCLIVIVDITLDAGEYDYSGLELIKELSKSFPFIKTICFSMHKNPGFIQMALDNGAVGFISKTASEEELLKCMDIVNSGNEFIEDNLNQSMKVYEQAISSLTKREKLVVELIIKHKTNDEIAAFMNIQKRAVESYTSRIYDKTGCKNRAELVSYLG